MHTCDDDPCPWICSVCGVMYVVRSLARDCERRHERNT
jgi:hypothetical protein